MNVKNDSTMKDISRECDALACSAIQFGEFHVELTKDEKKVLFYPCCANWLDPAIIPSMPLEELLENYNKDNLFELLQSKRSEMLRNFDKGSLCKYPLACNKELSLIPAEERYNVRWLIASTFRGCNLDCIMCNIATRHTSPAQLKLTKMLHECVKGRGLENFTPTMAEEPFAMDFFMDWCLSLTKEDTKALYIVTNASLLSIEAIDNLYTTLTERDIWFRFSVSIDSVHPERYEAIRRGSSFDTVIANAQHMAKLGILQSINYVVLPGINEDELEYAQASFKDMGLPEPELLFDTRPPPGLSSFKVSTLKAVLNYKVFYNRPRQEIEPEIARRQNEACSANNRSESK